MTNQLPLIFRDACGGMFRDKYDFSRPFGMNGVTFASDGAIIVAAAGECEPGTNVPDVLGLPWNPDLYSRELHALPGEAAIRAAGETCKCCKGVGTFVREVCDECDGFGEVEGFGDFDDAPCDNCNATGYLTDAPDPTRRCPECKGNGVIFDYRTYVQIGPERISPAYALILVRNGVRHVRVHKDFAGERVMKGGRNHPALFVRGDGWDGLLMPVSHSPDAIAVA